MLRGPRRSSRGRGFETRFSIFPYGGSDRIGTKVSIRCREALTNEITLPGPIDVPSYGSEARLTQCYVLMLATSIS